MNQQDWESKTIAERMEQCYREAGLIDNGNYVQVAVLAVGLYNAYRHAWGS